MMENNPPSLNNLPLSNSVINLLYLIYLVN